ncbi:MAG: type II toxin-antitoxin system prevent-host-death family antitoxin [Hydrogenophilales bacterium CG17_big_fil_post_rev_8_21_14_2_50_63_12]|nr:MAG: type II toxin-antitoxin system prevent-host-death family antitoxin [Hydrogenophilales bacterium CG17_big_fil_post_rev_8_21_14_2_50_63_12]PIX97411.1 MAG: type II toxin-antitoxin system prevent-host-death family antitoxin [Hydrogenophilales bacterium CG_4_10_14_3_um_filter_63_21]PJB03791.1 MAG: type II toxin-antitoxin system prevent-host-death family antitoxin [Hydrogenophilales bacterium CG_4_9_14_3_um_filter_63_34]
METSVRELKTHLSEYLRHVAAGEEVVVTSHGKPVARLTAVLPRALTEAEREAEAIAKLEALPWVRPGRGGKLMGSTRPIKIAPGDKTLSEIVSEMRE